LSSFPRCTLDVIYKDFANCALCLNPHIVSLFGIIKVLKKKNMEQQQLISQVIFEIVKFFLFIYFNFVVSKIWVLMISPFFFGLCKLVIPSWNSLGWLLSPHIFILSNVPNKPILRSRSLCYFHSSFEYVSEFPMLFSLSLSFNSCF